MLAPHIHGIHKEPGSIQCIEPFLRARGGMSRFSMECKISVIGCQHLEIGDILIVQMHHSRILIAVKASVFRHITFSAHELLTGCTDQINPHGKVMVCLPQRKGPQYTDRTAIGMPARVSHLRKRVIFTYESCLWSLKISFLPIHSQEGMRHPCIGGRNFIPQFFKEICDICT